MNHSIENESIILTVAEKGAEMQSIYSKKTGKEYLWQGNPDIWAGRAYNLFPTCGKMAQNKYTFDGKEYEMNPHGFARRMDFVLTDMQDEQMSFTLRANETTLKAYPFLFEFTITYTLANDTVVISYEVKNEDSKTMLFAIGGHPGFNVPLCEREVFEDYYLEFYAEGDPKEYVMNSDGYFSGRMRDFPLRGGRILNLSHKLFNNDAIFLDGVINGVTLKSSQSKHFVHVHFAGMKCLGIWHKPNIEAPYVCIEPWSSCPVVNGDAIDFRKKPQNLSLAPAKTYKTSMTITIG